MKTLYISDLDGTLLNRQTALSEKTLTTLNQMIAEGMFFTYATARSLNSASVVTQGLKLNLPVIVYNGTFIMEPNSGDYILQRFFSDSEKETFCEYLSKNPMPLLVYSFVNGRERVSYLENPIGSKEGREGFFHYLECRKGDRRFHPVKQAKELFEGQNYYYTLIGGRDELAPAYEYFMKQGNCNCIFRQEIYRTEYWCEILPQKATKASGVLALKEMFHADRIICFGDGINDVPMFSVCDEAYAPANAEKEALEAADAVIEENDKDGVIKWLAHNHSF